MDNIEHGKKEDVRIFSLSPFAGKGIKGQGHENTANYLLPCDSRFLLHPRPPLVIPRAPFVIPAKAGMQ